MFCVASLCCNFVISLYCTVQSNDDRKNEINIHLLTYLLTVSAVAAEVTRVYLTLSSIARRGYHDQEIKKNNVWTTIAAEFNITGTVN